MRKRPAELDKDSPGLEPGIQEPQTLTRAGVSIQWEKETLFINDACASRYLLEAS